MCKTSKEDQHCVLPPAWCTVCRNKIHCWNPPQQWQCVGRYSAQVRMPAALSPPTATSYLPTAHTPNQEGGGGGVLAAGAVNVCQPALVQLAASPRAWALSVVTGIPALVQKWKGVLLLVASRTCGRHSNWICTPVCFAGAPLVSSGANRCGACAVRKHRLSLGVQRRLHHIYAWKQVNP